MVSKRYKSSSGTFLNHIRLSPASQESSLMPIIDGDIIQLGMDYRGGTEEVYRLVKMRCHFNNSWQRKMNPYNIEMFKKLQIGDKQATECSICLNAIQPGHPLFISTCGHWWHYRCIHPLLQKSYPCSHVPIVDMFVIWNIFQSQNSIVSNVCIYIFLFHICRCLNL